MPEPATFTLPPNPFDAFTLSKEDQARVIDEFKRLMEKPSALDKVDFTVTELPGTATKEDERDRARVQEHATSAEGVDFSTACRRAEVDYYSFKITRQRHRIMPGDFGFVCDSLEEEYRELATGRLRVLAMSRNNITALKHTGKAPETIRVAHTLQVTQPEHGQPQIPQQPQQLPALTAKTAGLISKTPPGKVAELEAAAQEMEARKASAAIDAEFTQNTNPQEDTHRDP